MSKSNDAIVSQILNERVVAIARGILPRDMEALTDALHEGGIGSIEFTFDHSGVIDPKEMLAALSEVRRKGIVTVGVGTVLSTEQVQQAAEAGAQFVLSPDFSPAVVRKTKELGLVSIPGALTPSEIVQAYTCGADIVKIFPAGPLGSGYIKALRGPLPHIPFSAVGGVSADNAAEYLAAGANCLGIGGKLVDAEAVARGDFQAITAAARALLTAINQA